MPRAYLRHMAIILKCYLLLLLLLLPLLLLLLLLFVLLVSGQEWLQVNSVKTYLPVCHFLGSTLANRQATGCGEIGDGQA